MCFKKNCLNRFIIIALFFGVAFCGGFYWYFTQYNKVEFEAVACLVQKPGILLIDMQKGFGGGQVATMAHYKALVAAGYPTQFLVFKGGYLDKELTVQHISHYACRTWKTTFKKYSHLLGFSRCISDICSKEKIKLIHCNNEYEVFGARSAIAKRPIKLVLTRHMQQVDSVKALACVDGVIGVGKATVASLQKMNTEKGCGVKHIVWIPPFWNYEKFAQVAIPTMNRNQFFRERFGETLQTPFVMLKAAAFLKYKNHQFMLYGLKRLVELGKPVDVVFAGAGDTEKSMKQLAKSLGVEKYVHFLGFVTSDMPSVVSYADLVFLVSLEEGLPIALMEGALLHKPLLGVADTGMESIIVHEKTGLLVAQGNVEELAQAIIRLREDADLCKELGQTARIVVEKELSPEAIMSRLAQFYDVVLTVSF